MAKNRIARDEETRETDERPAAWVQPSVLPDVQDRDDGFGYRWVRISTMEKSDARNVSMKLREGWVPCLAKDHPEIYGDMLPESDRFAENIVMGGLMLCKAPKEMVEARDAHFNQMTRGQMHSVDNNFMQESHPEMPLFNENKSKVTFGTGN